MSTHRIALRESVSEIVGAMRFIGSSNDIYALSFLSSTSDRSIFLPHSSFGIYPRRSEIAYVRNADGWIEEKIGGSIFIRFALLALYIYIDTIRTFLERTREFERKIGKRIRRSFVAPTLYRLTWIIRFAFTPNCCSLANLVPNNGRRNLWKNFLLFQPLLR